MQQSERLVQEIREKKKGEGEEGGEWDGKWWPRAGNERQGSTAHGVTV